jgi:hypothetical protein
MGTPSVPIHKKTKKKATLLGFQNEIYEHLRGRLAGNNLKRYQISHCLSLKQTVVCKQTIEKQYNVSYDDRQILYRISF